ncbi:MAG: ATP-dependent DNA helicase RecQ [Deltaproteobacteria bacterium]|nr:ATP-dependent DNA helicase RecQ [Deltaproteobacteria bacterium]
MDHTTQPHREKSEPTARGVQACDIDTGLDKLGYDGFRPGQREAVEILLDTGRLLLVAPTGGGKSLIYQLPAVLLPGTTLVISPLIALMNDQVDALERRGVSATYLAGTLEPEELRRRMSEMARGRFQLVYVAPERLSFPAFRGLLRQIEIPLVAVDEAHCISEWGHDFRPEYMEIGGLIADLRDARVLACTATATPVVRDEILERLGLDDATPQLLRGFARPNLSLRVAEVKGKGERKPAVDGALAEALGGPGQGQGAAIIYSPTRRASEEESERLADQGWRVDCYHAGLDPERRSAAQRRFANGETEVVVATNAFGMGIDRADVRAVIHLAPPGSIESYYQEVGRAGRDDKAALGLMLTGPGDLARRRFLIENDASGAVPNPEVVQHKWNLFLELMRFAEGGSCRHDAVLRYFGDEAETLAGCGKCDVCIELAAGGGGDEHDPEEVSLLVRKALSAVARVHGRFGLSAAVKLLRGAEDERLMRMGLHETRTFGILSEIGEEWLTRLLRRCVTAGWVDFEGADRPVVVLTEDGAQVMRGEAAARLLLPPKRRRRSTAASPARRPRAAAAHASFDEDVLDGDAQQLFEALRKHRLAVARAEGVPPYVVASDRTLRDIALMRPGNVHDLQLAHGIGPAKAERFGPGLLAVVAEH